MTRSAETDRDAALRYRETTERFWVLRLVTEVRDDGVYVRVGPLHRSFRRIPSEAIEEARTATYSPGTYGGWHWGVRTSPGGNTAYRLRGNRGVELRRTDGSRLFVGSQRPSELESAIHRITDAS